MKISPAGDFIAAIARENKKHYLLLIDLQTGKKRDILEGDLYSLSWLTNERLLVYDGGKGEGGLFAINRDGSALKVLQKPWLSQLRGGNFRSEVVLRVGVGLTNDAILIQKFDINPFVKAHLYYPDVYALNIFNGQRRLVEKNPGEVVGWMADGECRVRGALAIRKETFKLLYRKPGSQAWVSIAEAPINRESYDLLGMSSDGEKVFVGARGEADTVGLFEFDPQRRALGRKIFQNDQYDLRSVFARDDWSSVEGVFYTAEKPKIEWFASGWRDLQASVDGALPDAINYPVSASANGEKVIFRSFSDRSPGSFYLVDNTRHEFGILANIAGWIKPAEMSPMKAISYRSRDGLLIPGYLTIPHGSSGTNLPMVVVPHGGPQARDVWGFDNEVQFLANRGYAVLQINFRGSTGYGYTFRHAGFKQWGLAMQDDITDGVEWAITTGVADRQRIAIFGASYGGYAALMGLIKTPSLFRCGISYVGVTDINLSLRQNFTRLPSLFGALAAEQIGDYRDDKDDLSLVSPVNLAEKIKVPVLLAYGAKDFRVDVKEGRSMARALKKNRVPCELIVEPEEGHGFHVETNRIKLFQKIEAFLKTNLSVLPAPKTVETEDSTSNWLLAMDQQIGVCLSRSAETCGNLVQRCIAFSQVSAAPANQ